MNSLDKCFELLEIEPTENKQIIKKAYAAAIRKYHPEDEPEMFQQVRDAYEFLMSNTDEIKERTYEENRFSNVSGTTQFRPKGTDVNPQPQVTIINSGNMFDQVWGGGSTAPLEDENELSMEDEFTRMDSQFREKTTFYSKNVRNDYMQFEELFRLLSRLDSGDPFRGRKTVNKGILNSIRMSDKYFDALRSPDFIKQYTDTLSRALIDIPLANLIREDVETVISYGLSEYSFLLGVLERNKTDINIDEIKKKIKKEKIVIPLFFIIPIIPELAIIPIGIIAREQENYKLWIVVGVLFVFIVVYYFVGTSILKRMEFASIEDFRTYEKDV